MLDRRVAARLADGLGEGAAPGSAARPRRHVRRGAACADCGQMLSVGVGRRRPLRRAAHVLLHQAHRIVEPVRPGLARLRVGRQTVRVLDPPRDVVRDVVLVVKLGANHEDVPVGQLVAAAATVLADVHDVVDGARVLQLEAVVLDLQIRHQVHHGAHRAADHQRLQDPAAVPGDTRHREQVGGRVRERRRRVLGERGLQPGVGAAVRRGEKPEPVTKTAPSSPTTTHLSLPSGRPAARPWHLTLRRMRSLTAYSCATGSS